MLVWYDRAIRAVLYQSLAARRAVSRVGVGSQAPCVCDEQGCLLTPEQDQHPGKGICGEAGTGSGKWVRGAGLWLSQQTPAPKVIPIKAHVYYELRVAECLPKAQRKGCGAPTCVRHTVVGAE